MDQDQRRRNPDLYDAYQKAKLAFAIGRAVPWVWIIIITIAGIVLSSAVIGVLTGTQGAGTSTPPSTKQTQLTTCTDLSLTPEECLMKDFNIEAQGFKNNKQFAQEAYNAFSIAYNQSTIYRGLWNNGGKKLILIYGKPANALVGEGDDCQGQAFPSADAPDGTQIDDRLNIWNFGGKCGFAGGEAYLIIHETGHILAGRNISIFNKFHEAILAASDGDKCYKTWTGKPNYLKTYMGPPGTDPRAEGFAEGIADYVLYRSWGRAAGLSDFPNQCKETYNWFKTNIFGVDLQSPVGSGL